MAADVLPPTGRSRYLATDGLYRLSEESEYPLPFAVWGYYASAMPSGAAISAVNAAVGDSAGDSAGDESENGDDDA